ncbi:hypothetical protein [Streptomyces griseus]|uniref:hypothetical protein n=1 Tax=Streptomyces griseus TaxID=1911 RepID=UPI000A39DD2F|nr:hypothetical protein [Streptomyces fimicarius]
MLTKALIEEITLIAEAGDTSDALDLSRQLIRAGSTKRAIDVRRTVVKGEIDRDALRALAVTIAEDEVRALDAHRRQLRSLAREARTLGMPAFMQEAANLMVAAAHA